VQTAEARVAGTGSPIHAGFAWIGDGDRRFRVCEVVAIKIIVLAQLKDNHASPGLKKNPKGETYVE
jgi:hypothetical protein